MKGGKNYSNGNIFFKLPLGTDCKLVMSTGSPKLRTDPNSEAQVSPLQQANAPAKNSTFSNGLTLAESLLHKTYYVLLNKSEY